MDIKKYNFDLVVIGAGPGGYVAAIRASQLGLNVAVIEEKHLGGICLNWGCIPTKALLKCSELNRKLKHLGDYGFSADNIKFDISKIVARSRETAAKLSAGIEYLMKKNKITVINGRGKILSADSVKVTDKEGAKIAHINAKNIIIATGARARILPNIPVDNDKLVTYKEAMVPKTLPKSLLVIGSGAIGAEFASFYQNMGVKTIIVEILDRILPQEDAQISKIAQKSFEKDGMKIYLSSKVTEVKKNKDELIVTIQKNAKEEKITVEKVILAAGIEANIEDLGIENTEIKIEKNLIATNEFCQTAQNNIYAIGDVTKGPWLAHKASHEGVIAAEHIAGLNPHAMKRENIPGCTYCTPQIASVGYTEQQAKDAGFDIKIGEFSYSANGKAIASGEVEGLVKTIFDKTTGELLGAHIIGADATEMIGAYLVGKSMEACEKDFMNVIFPHPTLSEMLHESVLDAFDKAIHS